MEIQHHHHHHQIILRGDCEGKIEEQQTKQQVQLNHPPPSSASSSPSHDFSFTISLHPPPPPPQPTADINNKSKPPPPHPPPPFAAAIDLSPADEIFFHGHLLPLHLLSGGGGAGHPSAVVSPRSSTNSLDSFTLPIKDNNNNDGDDEDRHICKGSSHVLAGKDRGKSKSFSLFGMPRKPRKGFDGDGEGQKRKSTSFELVIKRLVKPFLSLKRGNQELLRHPPPPPPKYNSYSGNLRVKNKKDFLRGRRRGEMISAPVSMRNSPTNSGVLAASGTVTPTKSDSTMEELQAAIQAAIAHCKKSIDAAGEDRVKLQP